MYLRSLLKEKKILELIVKVYLFFLYRYLLIEFGVSSVNGVLMLFCRVGGLTPVLLYGITEQNLWWLGTLKVNSYCLFRVRHIFFWFIFYLPVCVTKEEYYYYYYYYCIYCYCYYYLGYINDFVITCVCVFT